MVLTHKMLNHEETPGRLVGFSGDGRGWGTLSDKRSLVGREDRRGCP
jgi:hypothetical protein